MLGGFGVGNVLLFLPLCPSVLEPNLDLSTTNAISKALNRFTVFFLTSYLLLGDVERLGHFGSFRGRKVLFALKLLLQLVNLMAGESRSNFFLSSWDWTRLLNVATHDADNTSVHHGVVVDREVGVARLRYGRRRQFAFSSPLLPSQRFRNVCEERLHLK